MTPADEQVRSPDDRKEDPLRHLPDARAIYEVPTDDLASLLLIPAMKVASAVRIMVGFFSSQSFCQLAPGLAHLLERPEVEPLRLLISPRLTEEDRDAIRKALVEPEDVAESTFKRLLCEAADSESAIAAHAVDCLTFLLSTGRLQLRVVLMKEGLFHPKVWLFEAGSDSMAVHGSSNLTKAGLLYNGELVSVDRPWHDGEAAQDRVRSLFGTFESYWCNERWHSITVGPNAGLLFGAREGLVPPTPEDFWRAWDEDHQRGLAPKPPGKTSAEVLRQLSLEGPQALSIPRDLNWESGAFAHQGQAVRAWEENERTGVLAIATGGGKTTSALIAATRLQDESDQPLLVLILVPSNPLLDQWEREVAEFGVRPHALGRIAAADRISELHGVVNSLSHGVAETEVLISSNQLYTGSEPLRRFLRELPPEIEVLLIADEVHNLGAPSFMDNPPTEIRYRLGLSATPIRQYDAEGTAELLQFFGQVVFHFELGDAIRAGCLTPYNYELHEVRLTQEELDAWEELSESLRRRNFRQDDEGQVGGLAPEVQRLLERRRAVLENATGKLAQLRSLLVATPCSEVSRTLIYTSAKGDPLGRERQILLVNRMLNELSIISHQLTYAETGGPQAARLLRAFAAGHYQALTCMKVLDEGLDVPATSTAYLLASSTVLREWVQRRGRVLRKAPGKRLATLHDFFVVPPDTNSKAGRAILRAERARADEFCRLAGNAWDNDGPRLILERYT